MKSKSASLHGNKSSRQSNTEKLAPPNGTLQLEFDALKVQTSDTEIAIRKARYQRQGFVPASVRWRGLLLSDPVDEAIALELGFPIEVRIIEFSNETDAKLWILEGALDAPSLNPFQRIRLNLQRKALLSCEGRNRMAAGGKGLTELSNLPSHNTRREIAKSARTSEGLVHKVEHLLESASPETLTQLETGQTKISAAFDSLRGDATPTNPQSRYEVIFFEPPTGLGTKRFSKIPLKTLAADAAVYFCLVPPRDLLKALSLMRKGGFKYQTHFVVPSAKTVVCDFVQESHDVLLLSTRGAIAGPAIEDLPTTLLACADPSSRYEVLFSLIEKLFTRDAKLQILPRAPRMGWSEWDFRS